MSPHAKNRGGGNHQERVRRAAREAVRLTRYSELRQAGRRVEVAQREAGLSLPHATLYRRLSRLQEGGASGLVECRHPPPSKLTPEIRAFVEALGAADPGLKSREIARAVADEYGISLVPRTVSRVLKKAGLARPVGQNRVLPKPGSAAAEGAGGKVQMEELGGAGLALLTLASELTGYGLGMAAAIQEAARGLVVETSVMEVDRSHRDEEGKFLPAYNLPRARRDPNVGAVFDSVEVKRASKDLARMQITTISLEILEKKLLAFMALPIVSEKGSFDGVRDPRGEWLASLGWLDYMPETLAKLGRELKYAGVSQALLEKHAEIWHRELSPSLGQDASLAVLYVDGTSKPYWTEQFHLSGRVATLGRVMPCLETVLIHTGSGVPLYLKTFAGHAPLVTNLLPLLHEFEEIIGKGMLGRLTVVDGEMNSVELFKAFDQEGGGQKRWFITPIRTAQIRDLNSIEGYGHLVRYREKDWVNNGEAWLELRDSKKPRAKPYRARAIIMQRGDREPCTVFVSNAPWAAFDNAQLLDAFFQRWPAQEQVFRNLNGGFDFKAVHGRGKQKILNVTVIDEITKTVTQIENAAKRLEKARATEVKQADSLHALELEERRLARLADGARHSQAVLRKEGKAHTKAYATRKQAEATAKAAIETASLRVKLARAQQTILSTKASDIERQIQRKSGERKELESRREIYANDTELDQILSVFKLGCALLIQVILHRFFDGQPIEFNTFIHQILALRGTRIRTPTTELIRFRAHRRYPEMMQRLEAACVRINALNHVNREGRCLRFELSWPPGARHAK